MEKNKTNGTAIRLGGARYFSDYCSSGNNGYGINSDAPFSDGAPLYTSAKNRPMIKNDNFTEERFSGDVGGQPRINASNSDKDSIETMGGVGDDLNRRAF